MPARKTRPDAATGAEPLHVDDRRAIPRAELKARASRAGGAGGQHVNTSSTRVEVLWNPTTSSALAEEEKVRVLARLAARLDAEGNVRVVASDTRSQKQNRELAESRLAEMVRRALVVPKKRKATKPSRGERERRLEAKKHVSRKKSDRQSKNWE
ncbi:MAG: alternative ribosome rescue aminoacyl-tRNA hydrolase ArfB [Gemmatimonadaceae bacterium]